MKDHYSHALKPPPSTPAKNKIWKQTGAHCHGHLIRLAKNGPTWASFRAEKTEAGGWEIIISNAKTQPVEMEIKKSAEGTHKWPPAVPHFWIQAPLHMLRNSPQFSEFLAASSPRWCCTDDSESFNFRFCKWVKRVKRRGTLYIYRMSVGVAAPPHLWKTVSQGPQKTFACHAQFSTFNFSKGVVFGEAEGLWVGGLSFLLGWCCDKQAMSSPVHS